MRKRRYVVQVSFTYQEYLQLNPLLTELQEHIGMNKSQLIKRMIAYHGSRIPRRSDPKQMVKTGLIDAEKDRNEPKGQGTAW